MSEVRLVVREADCDWSGTIHGSDADCAIAALSADPVTLQELEAAMARYAKPSDSGRFLGNLRRDRCDEPHDAGLVAIDLVARLILVASNYSSPGLTGHVAYHDGKSATDIGLRYHLADDWLMMSDIYAWRPTADARRREHAANPPLDAREVFYGHPLLEFLARKAFAAFRQQKAPNEGEVYETLKQIHADWLLTPRDDLRGQCPREVVMEHHNHMTWDIELQAERWSRVRERPPGLEKPSFAFRHSGFGTSELVTHYDLVRELLGSCWSRLAELRKEGSSETALGVQSVGDFLTNEIARLENVRDEWLEMPNPEYRGRTPRAIVERERLRLPDGGCGHEMIIDPECPCCQILADMPGPMFWYMDGCNMDEGFAFDISHRTHEDYEEAEREREEFDKRFDAEWEERKRLGVTSTYSDNPDEKSVWSSSFSVADLPDVPLGIRLFGIGCHLAELFTNLRGEANDPTPETNLSLIDRLNRDFGNLRELLQKSEPELAAALLSPVLEHFADTLAVVASTQPALSSKCESLQECLTRFLDPPREEPNWDDFGQPF